MRILLIRLSSFGDMVFTLPLARALFAWQGSAEIGWVTERPFAGLLEGAPYIHRIFFASTRAWRKAPLSAATRREIGALGREVKAFDPDLVVDAHGLLKASWISLLAPRARKVGFGPGSAGERLASFFSRERVETPGRPHLIDRALALAEYLSGKTGWDRTPDIRHLVGREDTRVDSWLAERAGRPFALFIPFSSVREKEWSQESQAEVAASLLTRDGIESFVKWGPAERERAEAIVRASGGRIELAPEAGAAATARLSARASLVLGVDTGPTHLAAAAGAPVVALFGPTDPLRFAPAGPRTRVLLPPGGRPGALPEDPAAILAAARELMAGSPPAAP